MGEIWKPVVGFEDRYIVSSMGAVASLNYHREGRIKNLKPSTDKDGYQKVLLYYGQGVRTSRAVHILVAEAFIEEGFGKPQVNHKNGIKSDNRASNLEWVTALENLAHSFKFLGRKVASGSLSKCAKEYLATAPDGTLYHVKGLKAFCNKHGLLQGEMTNVVSGRAKSHRGWKCQHKPLEVSNEIKRS